MSKITDRKKKLYATNVQMGDPKIPFQDQTVYKDDYIVLPPAETKQASEVKEDLRASHFEIGVANSGPDRQKMINDHYTSVATEAYVSMKGERVTAASNRLALNASHIQFGDLNAKREGSLYDETFHQFDAPRETYHTDPTASKAKLQSSHIALGQMSLPEHKTSLYDQDFVVLDMSERPQAASDGRALRATNFTLADGGNPKQYFNPSMRNDYTYDKEAALAGYQPPMDPTRLAKTSFRLAESKQPFPQHSLQKDEFQVHSMIDRTEERLRQEAQKKGLQATHIQIGDLSHKDNFQTQNRASFLPHPTDYKPAESCKAGLYKSNFEVAPGQEGSKFGQNGSISKGDYVDYSSKMVKTGQIRSTQELRRTNWTLSAAKIPPPASQYDQDFHEFSTAEAEEFRGKSKDLGLRQSNIQLGKDMTKDEKSVHYQTDSRRNFVKLQLDQQDKELAFKTAQEIKHGSHVVIGHKDQPQITESTSGSQFKVLDLEAARQKGMDKSKLRQSNFQLGDGSSFEKTSLYHSSFHTHPISYDEEGQLNY